MKGSFVLIGYGLARDLTACSSVRRWTANSICERNCAVILGTLLPWPSAAVSASSRQGPCWGFRDCIATSLHGELLDVRQVIPVVLRQPFIMYRTVEMLHVGVLLRLTRLDSGAVSAGIDAGESSIMTTGTKADDACAIASCETAVPSRYSCSRTHLRNWFALIPAFRARPANDAPGRRQASINLRLPSESYRCLPSAHVRVTRRGRKSKSASVIICVRNSSLWTQSWIGSAAPARCGEFCAYERSTMGKAAVLPGKRTKVLELCNEGSGRQQHRRCLALSCPNGRNCAPCQGSWTGQPV